MTALLAVVIVKGADLVGDPVTVAGDNATRTLYLHPSQFTVEKDLSTTPPQVKVSIRASILSSIAALQETVSGLAGDLTELDGRVDVIEPYAVGGGRWDDPDIYTFDTDGATLEVSFGTMNRIAVDGPGSGEVMTVVLPLVGEADRGRRIGFRVITAGAVGSLAGAAEIYVTTSGGQALDASFALPYALQGVRPCAVFAACKISSTPDVYGWTVESES